ncbi:MAG: hypothetical protein ACKVQS_12645 [Fimbriimonadaceae bacterium]
MRLKTFTSGLMLFGIALLLGIPFLMARQPGKDAPKRELAVYAAMFGTYILVIAVVAVTAIICAMIVLRKTSQSLKDEAERNMKSFVEGSLRDHEEPDFSMKDQRDLSKGFPEDIKTKAEDWPEEDDVPKP